MLPATLADLNKDGSLDIIMMAFDGTLAAFSGEDLRPLWSPISFVINESSMETYT